MLRLAPRQLGKFEVLVGDKRAVRWVDFHGRCEVDKLPGRPVEGGREADGSPLFIAQGYYNNAIVPGKCGPKLPAAFLPYANSEKEVKVCYLSGPASSSAADKIRTTAFSATLERGAHMPSWIEMDACKILNAPMLSPLVAL